MTMHNIGAHTARALDIVCTDTNKSLRAARPDFFFGFLTIFLQASRFFRIFALVRIQVQRCSRSAINAINMALA